MSRAGWTAAPVVALVGRQKTEGVDSVDGNAMAEHGLAHARQSQQAIGDLIANYAQ